MTPAELRTLYETACKGKGYLGNDAQFKLWRQTLGWCEQADLAQALVWWFSDNANFPMPAELKPLVERARRLREIKLATPTEEIVWQCMDCHHIMSGFVAAGGDLERRCRYFGKQRGTICDARMEIVSRATEAAAQ